MIKSTANTSSRVNMIGGGPRALPRRKEIRAVISPAGETVTVTAQNAFDLVRIHGYRFASNEAQDALNAGVAIPEAASADAPPSAPDVVLSSERAPDTFVQAALDNLEGLRARAVELDIKFGQTWGLKKLRAAIEEAEAAASENSAVSSAGETADNG